MRRYGEGAQTTPHPYPAGEESLRTRVARFRQEGALAASEVAGVERPFRPPQPLGGWDRRRREAPAERPLGGGRAGEMEAITSE